MVSVTTVVEILSFLLFWIWDLILETIYFVFRCRPTKEIKNENILITGTGQGLGRLIAERLAKDGNTLHCVDINMELNQQLKEDHGGRNCTIHVYKCNVGDIDSVKRLGEEIKQNTPDKHVSYLFNVAGIVMGKTFEDETEQEMAKVISVNVLGPLYLQKLVYKGMVENYGNIVNISSLAGIIAGPMIVDYCTSKFAVTGMTRGMLSELEYRGINKVKVMSVHPHITKTGMFNNVIAKWPLVFPLLEPDWVADEIIKGTKENRDQIILPKVTNVFLLLEQFMSCRVFRKYSEFLGNDVMKTFKKIRAD